MNRWGWGSSKCLQNSGLGILHDSTLPWKWMVGILLSYWGGPFSGAMLVSGRVICPKNKPFLKEFCFLFFGSVNQVGRSFLVCIVSPGILRATQFWDSGDNNNHYFRWHLLIFTAYTVAMIGVWKYYILSIEVLLLMQKTLLPGEYLIPADILSFSHLGRVWSIACQPHQKPIPTKFCPQHPPKNAI